MIKKLRNKFILINMCFVAAILGFICVFLAVSFSHRSTQSSIFFLQNELRRAVQGNTGESSAFRIDQNGHRKILNFHLAYSFCTQIIISYDL